ncbi:MAG: hypothetical protein SCH70_03110 [Candidatus Methanoperedens sp.]|nr:hypothetical protein [Candidatus Methanoperedens sp.]
MVYIEEITEYFYELFRLWGWKVLVVKLNVLNIFMVGVLGQPVNEFLKAAKDAPISTYIQDIKRRWMLFISYF